MELQFAKTQDIQPDKTLFCLVIMPIKDLRNTTKISNIAHKEQEPIFITKNGYSDLVYAPLRNRV